MNFMPIMGTDLVLPMELFRQHAQQALINHGQSLDRLAERGGLAPSEAVAILKDRRWRFSDAYDDRYCLNWLRLQR